jgi:hypothetical protein
MGDLAVDAGIEEKNTALNRSVKQLLRAVLFMMLLAWLYLWISKVVNVNRADGLLFDEFYDLPKDSIDVCLVGTSIAFSSFEPALAYHNYGIAAYVFAGGAVPMAEVPFLIKEIEKTQSPDLYLIDLDTVASDSIQEMGFYTLARAWHDNPNKFAALAHMSKFTAFKTDYNNLSYFVPLMVFHTRWKSLVRADFLLHDISYLGYIDNTGIQSVEPLTVTQIQQRVFPGDRTQLWVSDLIEYLKETGLNVTFINIPRDLEEMQAKKNWVADYVSACGFAVIDSYDYSEDIHLDYETDFLDADLHMNNSGATKYTDWLGGFLADKYGLPDRRGDDRYSLWANEYERWVLSNIKIERVLRSYLNRLQDNADRYTVYIAAKGESSERLSEAEKLGLADIGLRQIDDLCLKKNLPYVAVIDRGNLVCERTGAEALSTLSVDGTLADGTDWGIVSSGRFNDVSFIEINGTNHAINSRGLNFVVYDNATKTVIDSVAFNTNQAGAKGNRLKQ